MFEVDKKDSTGLQSLLERISANPKKRGSSSKGHHHHHAVAAAELASLSQEKSIDPYIMSLQDLEIIAKSSKAHHFKKGEVIIQQGHFVNRIYQVVRGRCRVETNNLDNTTSIVGYLKPRNIFGEISYIDHGTANASVIADSSDVELLILEHYYIKTRFEIDQSFKPKFYRLLASQVASKIRQTDEKVYSFDNYLTTSQSRRYNKEGWLLKAGSSKCFYGIVIDGFFLTYRVRGGMVSGMNSSILMTSNPCSSLITNNVPVSPQTVIEPQPIRPMTVDSSASSSSGIDHFTSEFSFAHQSSTSSISSSSLSVHKVALGPHMSVNSLSLVSAAVAQAPVSPRNKCRTKLKTILALDSIKFQADSTSFRLEGKKNLSFTCLNPGELNEWVECLHSWTEIGISTPHNSFAPLRNGINCKWLVDGQDAWKEYANAIENAKETIFIADWFLVPEIYLRRDSPQPSLFDRLDMLLAKKANEGVGVFVLVWHETSVAMKLNSANAERKLESMNKKNIHVIRHPPLEPLNWSHHDKILVVDSDIAFIGGLDLCFGRWDNNDHRLIDDCHLKTTWPGKDFANNTRQEIYDVDKPFVDQFDRTSMHRMPWHDIQVMLDGLAARDVAASFIQRWNHHKDFMSDKNHPYLQPKITAPKNPRGTCDCQILRSISEWSGGNRTERSIYHAYLDAIEQANHFIYIENQFFISSLAASEIQNLIADRLVAKIRRAHKRKQVFRVIIVIPVHPDSPWEDNPATRYIMKMAI
eukprot:TRINITY_DN5641_c0_g1_i10.p1 TRINITY_DN5641_c0_g1~~TRINITY_DN5641_c0_g1_i10.p1  ORF type:complete len:765 (-),score=221.57 TRINITY_DN5641_c0_g1_i10:921-3182(-)